MPMSHQVLLTIASIQDLFDTWRALGSKRLRNGTELITRIPDGDGSGWMHVLFPRLNGEQLKEFEHDVGAPLPRDLRSLYSVMGGMSLFGGMFRLFGRRRSYVYEWDESLQPPDLLELNHELGQFAWKTESIVAFAVNAWDLSVHAFGHPGEPNTIVRLDRQSGDVLERHANVWDLLDAKLHRLDDLMLK
jgi:hypothetical protein